MRIITHVSKLKLNHPPPDDDLTQVLPVWEDYDLNAASPLLLDGLSPMIHHGQHQSVPYSHQVVVSEALAEEKLLLARTMMTGGEIDGGHRMVDWGAAAQDRSEALTDGHV